MRKENLKIVQVREEVGRDAVSRGIPVVKPEIGQFLSVLTRGAKAKRILEIGTAVGYSTLWFAEAIWDNDGEIVTIEKDEGRAKEAEANFCSAGVTGMIKVYNCDASQLLPSLQGSFDCIFLDAAKGQYLDYLPKCLQLLTSGGLLIADNVLFRGMIDTEEEPPKRYRSLVRKLRLFIDEIKSNDQLVSSILDIGDGMAVCVRR
jgi:predicted O-methyltransferase YrrM